MAWLHSHHSRWQCSGRSKNPFLHVRWFLVPRWPWCRIQKATSVPTVWCRDSNRTRQPSEMESRNKVKRAWPPPLNRKISEVLGVSIRSQLTDPELETSLAREWRSQRMDGVGEACLTSSWGGYVHPALTGILGISEGCVQEMASRRWWARNDYLEHEIMSLQVFCVNLIVSHFISALGWKKTSKRLFSLHGSSSSDCLGFIQCKHKFPEKHKATPVLKALQCWMIG